MPVRGFRVLVMTASTLLVLAGCGPSDEEILGNNADQSTPAASTPQAGTRRVDARHLGRERRPVQAGAGAAGRADGCEEAAGALTPGVRYVVVLKTSCGTIRIDLDQKAHPKTANAVASLVREGYYDNTIFHRVVNGWVVQGGDPTGTGSGGPSWSLVEAPGKTAKYTRGTVAMAKTGTDPAGTIGSQFFIVVADDAGLPADYAIAGKVTSGIAAADAMSDLQARAPTAPRRARSCWRRPRSSRSRGGGGGHQARAGWAVFACSRVFNPAQPAGRDRSVWPLCRPAGTWRHRTVVEAGRRRPHRVVGSP